MVTYLRVLRHERAIELRKKGLFAETHRRRRLLRLTFSEWRLLRRQTRARADAVRRHFLRYLVLRSALRSWRAALARQQMKEQRNMRQAEAIANLRLLRRHLTRWQGYLVEERVEKEADRRTSLAWSKARGLLYREADS